MVESLYISQYIELDELNYLLNNPENSNLDILFVDSLYINADDLCKINFPYCLKEIFIRIVFTNFMFKDKIFTNSKLTEYFTTSFFELWKIPFGCNITFRIAQNLWDMTDYEPAWNEEDTFKKIDEVYCEWVIQNNKVIYDSITSMNQYGTNCNSTKILQCMYEEAVKNFKTNPV